MAWEIAIIVDPQYDPLAAGSLRSDMPLWIVDTDANRKFATKLREAATYVWLEEPICTTFSVADLNTREHNCLNILDTVIEHHPKIAKLHFVGAQSSEHLISGVTGFGFVPFEPNQSDVVFVKPISSMKDVPHLQLDATNWNNANDIYESLFAILGSPTWHGKNFNAPYDSRAGGGINTLEVPYNFSIRNLKLASLEVQGFVTKFADLITRLQKTGCPVSIQVEN
jgi:hypothetical protein